MTNTISNAQATDFSSRITSCGAAMPPTSANKRCIMRRHDHGSVQYIENASRADAHRAIDLPVGYRLKGQEKQLWHSFMQML
jgi:hypothetical protein